MPWVVALPPWVRWTLSCLQGQGTCPVHRHRRYHHHHCLPPALLSLAFLSCGFHRYMKSNVKEALGSLEIQWFKEPTVSHLPISNHDFSKQWRLVFLNQVKVWTTHFIRNTWKHNNNDRGVVAELEYSRYHPRQLTKTQEWQSRWPSSWSHCDAVQPTNWTNICFSPGPMMWRDLE